MNWLIRLLLLIFLSGSFGFSQSSSPTHLTTKAQAGDGAYKLLERFGVKSPCNLAYFYQINQLKRKQGLKVGKIYQLPILVYAYNGKSIRSTTGVNDYDWAVNVQKYNEAIFQMGLRGEDFRNDRQLWVPYSGLYCREEPFPMTTPMQQEVAAATAAASPANTSNRPLRGTYSIFGPKYERVPLESTELSGKVYYLVAGHGGPDPGAVGRYNRKSLCEDEYAYDITLRLARLLLANGATVYVITRDPDDGIRSGVILPCDKDEQCWGDQAIPINQKARLFQRSDAVNALYEKNKKRGVPYQRLIVIHVDSDSKRERVDMYFYHKQESEESRIFNTRLQETIRQKYEEYRKGRGYTGTVSSRDLHMLRETLPVTTFIELGNIRNPNDQARLVIEGNRQLVADWLLDGLIKDAKLSPR